MGKKKTSSRSHRSVEKKDTREKEADTEAKGFGKTQDLRKVAPVARMRGLQAICREKLAKDLLKLKTWQTNTSEASVGDAILTLGGIVNEMETLDSQLQELEESGFSPARKSFTAKTKEGDRVSVLEDKRSDYAEIMEPSKMVDLVVVKKRPGRGGGLVVEASDRTRMQVAVSHVALLTKAA